MPVDLSALRYIAFEINDECPLTHLHRQCPRNSDRWALSSRDRTLEIEDMVAFYNYCVELGFKGLVNVHYYNEPLATKEKLLSLVEALPEAKFSLWTNGVYLSQNPRKNSFLNKFYDVMITIYKHSNLSALANIRLHYPHVRFQVANLDDRKRISVLPRYNPGLTRCNRPNWELIVDYYGNIHMCCGDWKGEIKVGNILAAPISYAVQRWNMVREDLSAPWDEHSFQFLPEICQLCSTRTPGMCQVSAADTVEVK